MTVNVHDFGAVGDDEHDDTAAFQAAIDATAMEVMAADVTAALTGRLRGVVAETARNQASDAQDAARYLLNAYAAGRQRSTVTFTPSQVEPPAERFPDRFRVGDGPWMPCRITGFDFARSAPTSAAQGESFPRVAPPAAPRSASPFELASYELAAEYQITPGQVDNLIRAYEATVAFPSAAPAAATDPELEAAKNWPAQGNVCAHVCGPDPGHVCDARAVTHLTHPLPSGGTRTLPLCRPCANAEDTGGLAVPIPDQPRHSARIGPLLTAADPEPPAGTVVEMEWGERWWRDGGPGPCEWFPMSQLTNPDRHDPESWTKVAGNYGPVRVVETL